MGHIIEGIIPKKDAQDFKYFLDLMAKEKDKFFLHNDVILGFYKYCDQQSKSTMYRTRSSVYKFIKRIQELFFVNNISVGIMHRDAIAKPRFYLMSDDGQYVEELGVQEYLNYKDECYFSKQDEQTELYIDFMPFYDYSPSIRDSKTIGNGIRFLNRYLSSKIFNNPDKWNQKLFEFIKLHRHGKQNLFVNPKVIKDFGQFFIELEKMLKWLRTKKKSAPYSSVQSRMKKAGFAPGWGKNVERILETMQMLVDLLNEPDDSLLEMFLSSVPIPMLCNIAILSPHGFFVQDDDALGLPDTGGQVIYILDQVKALEKYLIKEFKLAGLHITPKIIVLTRLIPNAPKKSYSKRKERIKNTENSWILRIPFKDQQGKVKKDWISRFHIWPYLEQFAKDSAEELEKEFDGKPDLIIGNYSDGNIVASILSDHFDVIQCTISHALEMNKYPKSDTGWKELEDHYHFSLQYIADVLSMNKSDFIITSTQQEIIGNEDMIGQYEAYQSFVMPGLFKVKSGINLFAPKFNVIPPGVDEEVYFPYYLKERRNSSETKKWENRLFHDQSDDILGHLEDPEKPPIFTMARLDKIKNITGLIEAFGMSKKLRRKCNLIFAAGTTKLEESEDVEEQEEIKKTYKIIEKYKLAGKVRWLPRINKRETGEVYRIIADHHGIFVQPALFEAFGLTILEAMISGLPTFGPMFGGPSEIINYGENGFLLNTSKPRLMADGLEVFCEKCGQDMEHWNRISENAITRVQKHFTWTLYCNRLVSLAKIYGFWRYSVSSAGKVEMERYCHFIYHFLFKQRAKELLK